MYYYLWGFNRVSIAGLAFFTVYSIFLDPHLHGISYLGNPPLKAVIQFADRLPAMFALLTLPWGFKHAHD